MSSDHLTEEAVFRGVLTDVWKRGRRVAPRGMPIIEIENFSMTLLPHYRWMNFEARKFKLDYLKAEFRWYLKGDPADLSIAQHAQLWSTITNEDGTVNSNYGHELFRQKQFHWVVHELRRDPDSRRASVVILRREHLNIKTKDVPCTYGMNFRLREGRLNMSVHMRSQDAIWGAGNDIPCFSLIHEMMGVALGVELGFYHHAVDSFHVYERHWDMLEEIVEGSPWHPVDCPMIETSEEVWALVDEIDRDTRFIRWLHATS